MAVKTFEIPDIGTVRITKRSGTRSVRLTIGRSGEVRVSIPAWSPYQGGLDFARSKAEWIRQHLPAEVNPLQAGSRIGKAHRLVFAAAAIDAPMSRLSGSEIRVSRPLGMAVSHPAVQKVARRAGIRALRAQAEALLPQRLRALAAQYGFTYNSVRIKQLKGRWGSCDAKQDIVLNLFLMQLPWQLIDYVLVHELTHTKHLNHSAAFWAEFTRHIPRAKYLRRVVQRYKPALEPVLPAVGSGPGVA